MDFYESMINSFSEKLRAAVTPTDEEKHSLLAELMDSAACRALEDIRTVLDDDRLDDPNCFWRIKKIVNCKNIRADRLQCRFPPRFLNKKS